MLALTMLRYINGGLYLFRFFPHGLWPRLFEMNCDGGNERAEWGKMNRRNKEKRVEVEIEKDKGNRDWCMGLVGWMNILNRHFLFHFLLLLLLVDWGASRAHIPSFKFQMYIGMKHTPHNSTHKHFKLCIGFIVVVVAVVLRLLLLLCPFSVFRVCSCSHVENKTTIHRQHWYRFHYYASVQLFFLCAPANDFYIFWAWTALNIE